MDRAYTVSEIDDLRAAIWNKVVWGTYSGPARNATSGCFSGNEVEERVEMRIRTTMLAGHTAEDLYASEAKDTQ